MKRSVICMVLAAAALAACNNAEREARARLEGARGMYERSEYFAAKSEIDSIRALYPKEFKVLREGLSLMRLIELKEAERTVSYCDSLIPVKEAEAEGLKKGFVFEKDSAYEETGNYVWKQQTVERNVQRCYIRSGVSEKGGIYLASVFYGAAPIKHTGIKVSTGDGQFAETAAIAYDGGMNYHFEDLGKTTEVVAYKGEKGIDAVKFISANVKERLRVDYTGGKPYTIYIAEGDKRAIAATLDLATVLGDLEKLRKEREKSMGRIAYLKNKLEETPEE